MTLFYDQYGDYHKYHILCIEKVRATSVDLIYIKIRKLYISFI